jgi:hypothetical protein
MSWYDPLFKKMIISKALFHSNKSTLLKDFRYLTKYGFFRNKIQFQALNSKFMFSACVSYI